MFCAVMSPCPSAATDFGVMLPVTPRTLANGRSAEAGPVGWVAGVAATGGVGDGPDAVSGVNAATVDDVGGVLTKGACISMLVVGATVVGAALDPPQDASVAAVSPRATTEATLVTGQRPMKLGVRFSAKALGPSLASSLENTFQP
jgi:hypothetical protein